ncbi:DUF4375 domain-containing protein [Brevundimonas sp.]|uniref:DMP19 family protein n=1 Tax=Brevundimonas sp. TaxID=1871086 RepID=UPI00262731F8|nr:DUF4375 domain-containing protein [Brevundimonas sp.]
MRIYDGPEIYLGDVAQMPTAALLLFACHWTQSEIQNGGLAQYFFNSTAVVAPDAVDGFRALHMLEAAEVLQQAMMVFGSPFPRDRDERLRPFNLPEIEDGRVAFRAFASATDDQFRALDDRFWSLMADPHEGFLAKANSYATDHRPNV